MNSKKQRGQSYICRAQMYEMLPRHAKFNPILLEHLANIPDEILENRASEWAAKLYRMTRQVGKEFGRARQFTRTQLNQHGILWGIININHKVEDMILQYFHTRFPRYIIVLYNQNSRISYICYESGKMEEKQIHVTDLIARLEKDRPLCEIIPGQSFNDEQLAEENQELFRVFYQSQNIAERKNPRYFQQMIPKRWQNAPGMEMEKGFLNNHLDQYIGDMNAKKTKEKDDNRTN